MRGLAASAPPACGAGHSLLLGRPVHFRPPPSSHQQHPPVVTTTNVPRYCQMSPGRHDRSQLRTTELRKEIKPAEAWELWGDFEGRGPLTYKNSQLKKGRKWGWSTPIRPPRDTPPPSDVQPLDWSSGVCPLVLSASWEGHLQETVTGESRELGVYFRDS